MQKAVENVPIGNLPELIKFARFLRSSYEEELASGKTKKAKKPIRQGGWIKGEVRMSEDFNDTLEYVSEEEMRVLEAMRAHKQVRREKPELQEEAV